MRNTSSVLLCALRSAGAAAFLAPAVGAKKLGVQEDAAGTYLVRLFAARNVALITGLALSKGEARKLWLTAGLACDALDIAAGLLSYRAGKERKDAIVDTAASTAATLMGLAGLKAVRKELRS